MEDFYTFRDGQAVKLDTSKMIIDSSGKFEVSKERGTFSWHKNSPNTFENDNLYYTEFEIDGDSITAKNQYKAIEKDKDSWEYNYNTNSISKDDFDAFAASNEDILVYQNNENNRAVQCKSVDEKDPSSSSSVDTDIVSVEDIDLSKFEEIFLNDGEKVNVEEAEEATEDTESAESTCTVAVEDADTTVNEAK